MERIKINTPDDSYTVYTGSGLRHNVLDFFPREYNAYYIITDKHVNDLYGKDLCHALSGYKTFIYTIEPGEASKSFQVYEAVLTDMLMNELDRSCCVIALGGGVVGDLAGFAASTFLRGIDYIQMPTTLLAHDSSVGGKVAINHAVGKNLIGAFYQPAAVIYDTDCLASLSEREWRSGFAELVKHALLDSEAFLSDLMKAVPDRTCLRPASIAPFLLRGIKVKADIVEKDVKEKGERMHLNLGHTLGHALEKLSGFGKLTHGEGVVIGMMFAIYISNTKGADIPAAELRKWLSKLGFSLNVPEPFTVDECLKTMFYDKKKNGDKINFILLNKIGAAYHELLSKKELKDMLTVFLELGGSIDN